MDDDDDDAAFVPTLEQIDEGTAEIRAAWSPRQRARRCVQGCRTVEIPFIGSEWYPREMLVDD